MDYKIIHDPENNIFYTAIEGKEAYLRYLVLDNNTLDLVKTYVPPELRGRGIAGIIVRFGLEYAKKNNKKIIPTCSYVAEFINKNKEYAALVKI